MSRASPSHGPDTARSLARPLAAGVLALMLAAVPAIAADEDRGAAAVQASADHRAEGDRHGAPVTRPVEPLAVEPRGLPVEMARTLQLLQDRIARGSTQAHLAQRQLLGHIEQRLLALEPDTWSGTANVHAAVTFVLAGGGPVVLRRILESTKLAEAEVPLVQGSLAYLEGREREAAAQLAKCDPRSLEPSLGGQVALVQSALAVRDAPARSIALLDLARLLAPGTLVEEGALRREVFVLAQGGDAKRFEALSIQYLRRFRRSVYAGNFRQRFAAALTRLDFDSDQVRVERLERMLDEIEPEGRRDLYLMVARAGLEQGRRETAVFAAERAAGLAPTDSGYAAQARLYRAAALIVADGRFDEGYEALRAVDRAALPEAGDAALLDAALSTAAQIRTPASRAVPAGEASAATVAKRIVPPVPSIARARDALARVDAMIKGSGP